MHEDTNINERNSERAHDEALKEPLDEESAQSQPELEVPLFLRDNSEGQKGDDQDEKDKSAE